MAAAEALFAADSAAVVAQLRALASSREVHARALTAASLVDLVCAMTASQPAAMRWLIDHAELAGSTSGGDRTVLRQALSLAGLGGNKPALHTIPGGRQMAWRVGRW